MFRLLRAELLQRIRRTVVAVGLVAIGVVIGSMAIAFLVLALVYALSPKLPESTAALLIAVIAGAVATATLTVGVQRLKFGKVRT